MSARNSASSLASLKVKKDMARMSTPMRPAVWNAPNGPNPVLAESEANAAILRVLALEVLTSR